jgi:predicted TIM-barrel fold metal-dependent hydrolase
MGKIIDLCLNLPLSAEEIRLRLQALFMGAEARGVANYRHIFGPRLAEMIGLSLEEIEAKRNQLSEGQLASLLGSIAEQLFVPPEAFVRELDSAGIDWGLVGGRDNEQTGAFVRRCPERFKGIATANPFTGVEAVRELERAVHEHGLVALTASPFDWKIPADDPRFYPLYAKAVELEIPVFIYTSMNYNTELPMDLARPLHLDAVAMAFPQMKIVAECGGWPWVPEMIGVARRHQNVYINTCSNRPKYLALPGSGWEMLIQYGNTLLQDRIVFASGLMDLGLPIGVIVNEMEALPLKDEVKAKWLYKNAQKLFDL